MDIRRRNFTLGLGATALSLGAGSSRVLAQSASEPGLILTPGPAGRCDDDRIGGPVVVWNEDDAQWWMYYYCRSSDFPEAVAPAFGTGSIALAKSPDGVNWTRYDGHEKGGAIMVPSDDPDAFDSMHIGTGQVLRHNGEWVMVYWGGDATLPTEIAGTAVHEGYQYKGYRCRPGIARSDDGIHWTRVKGSGTGGAAVNGDDTIYSAFPSMIYDGERFLIYYTALTPKIFHWETRIAASTDLVNWERVGDLHWADGDRLWERNGMVTRHVQPNFLGTGGKWLMIYAGLDGRYPIGLRLIGAAESDDGLSWRHLYDDPVFYPAPINHWDGAGTAYPNLVEIDGKPHMYYYGWPSSKNTFSPKRGIGLAVSETGDLADLLRIRPQGG